MTYTLHHGDGLDVLRTMADCSVDAVVTDPPYGLAFMGKRWDYDVPSIDVWAECLRVLKPGGHLLAFAGTRTQHRMAVRIEDAGFEIRDMIAWVYGSGFPKSLDVSKAIDRAAGAEREVVGVRVKSVGFDTDAEGGGEWKAGEVKITAPATPDAAVWAGWGTALKPALEPITVARKPLDGTVAANVLRWGTGALNVDGCRVGTQPRTTHPRGNVRGQPGAIYGGGKGLPTGEYCGASSRWPANLIHDGSDEVVGLFPQAGGGFGTENRAEGQGRYGKFSGATKGKVVGFGDTGSAARFFYCAKASKRDRDEGLDGFEARTKRILNGGISSAVNSDPRGMSGGGDRDARNHHPTVKPTDLMRYLCRLVTPPGGVVLDPFMGSGSTGKAAMAEGFRFIGIEREAEYVAIAEARIRAVVPTLFAAE